MTIAANAGTALHSNNNAAISLAEYILPEEYWVVMPEIPVTVKNWNWCCFDGSLNGQNEAVNVQ